MVARQRCPPRCAHEHLLFVGETEGDPSVEARLVEDLLGRQVDGFVYASMFTRQVTAAGGAAPVTRWCCSTA